MICFLKQLITEEKTYFTVADIISNHIAQNGSLEIAKTKAFCGYFFQRTEENQHILDGMGWDGSGSFWLVTIL